MSLVARALRCLAWLFWVEAMAASCWTLENGHTRAMLELIVGLVLAGLIFDFTAGIFQNAAVHHLEDILVIRLRVNWEVEPERYTNVRMFQSRHGRLAVDQESLHV